MPLITALNIFICQRRSRQIIGLLKIQYYFFLNNLNYKVDVMKHYYLVSLCSGFIDEVEIYDADEILCVFLEIYGVMVDRRSNARK